VSTRDRYAEAERISDSSGSGIHVPSGHPILRPVDTGAVCTGQLRVGNGSIAQHILFLAGFAGQLIILACALA
jgi:hypothetical protein